MSQSPIKGAGKPVVMRGLDPRIHPLLKEDLFESSPAMTGYEFGGPQ
jgi:hypothetical protein